MTEQSYNDVLADLRELWPKADPEVQAVLDRLIKWYVLRRARTELQAEESKL